MLSPIPYVGGKRKELKYIKENEPEQFTVFVDAFGGGGSVSLYYSQRMCEVHFNDRFEALLNMWEILSNEDDALKLQKRLGDLKPNEKLHEEMCACNKKYSDVEQLFYKARCNMTSDQFHKPNAKITPRLLRNKNGVLCYKNSILPKSANLGKYAPIVSKWKRTNKDFKEILKMYKCNENAFIYCDPPYISKTTTQYADKFTMGELFWLKDFMEDPSTKCKIMLNIDYTGWTRETFSKFVKTSYPVKYGLSTVKDIYQKYHLMCCNY